MTPDLTPEQLDLLTSLASGELSGEALARAEEAVASDAVLAAEYQLQVEARTYLTGQRVAPMAEFEAARMRRNVMDAIGPRPAQRATKQRSFSWAARLLPVAAALAVVVLGVGFIQNLGGQDTDMAADTDEGRVAAELPAAAEAPAETEAPAEESTADASMESEMHQAGGLSAAVEFVGPLTAEFIEQFPGDTPLPSIRQEEPAPLHVFLPCDGVQVDGVTHTAVTAIAMGVLDGAEAFLVELSEPGGPVVLLDPENCAVITP